MPLTRPHEVLVRPHLYDAMKVGHVLELDVICSNEWALPPSPSETLFNQQRSFRLLVTGPAQFLGLLVKCLRLT